MAETYTVKVVSEKEWEKLQAGNPRYANIGDSLGFADPEERKGYVRQTYWPELNKFLLDHEFEHLLTPENGADRDEHGVYHKKFFKEFLAPVGLPILGALAGPALGGLFAAGAGGLSGLGSALASGAGAAAGGALGAKISGGDVGKSALLSGATGLAAPAIGKVLGGIGSAIAPPASTGASITGTVAPQVAQASRVGSFAGRPAPFDLALQRADQSVTSRLGQGLTGLQRFSPTAPSFAPVAADVASQAATRALPPPIPPAPPVASGGGSFLKDLVKSVATGAAGGGLGSFLSGQAGGAGQSAFDLATAAGLTAAGEARQPPPIPNFLAGPLAQQAIAGTRGPTTEVGRLASTRLSEQLSQSYGGLPPDVQSGLQRTFDRRRAEITSQFKAFRPGADLATDSGYRQAMEDVDRQQAEATANLQLENQQQFEGNRRADIASALGLDEQSLNAALQLSGLEAEQIALQAGVDYGTAAAFKQAMGQFAGLFATRGLGLNRFSLDIPQLARA